MRIKNLKINDVFRIKNLDVEFSDTDNIICVIEKYKESDEIPFEENALLRVMETLFLDYRYYGADYLCGNGEIQCRCEKYKKDFLISLKGKNKLLKTTYQGKKIQGKAKGVEELCLYGEDVSRKMQRQADYDYRNFLYPRDMSEYCQCNKATRNAMEEVISSIHSEFSDSGWLTETEWKILQEKSQKYLNAFEGIPFLKGQPLTINQKGELKFQNSYDVFSDEAETYFHEEEYISIQFLYWLETLDLMKRLCADVGRDGNLPIFIAEVFEKINDGTDRALLLSALRRTGRQVFIFLNSPDETIEKYCDKVVMVDIE